MQALSFGNALRCLASPVARGLLFGLAMGLLITPAESLAWWGNASDASAVRPAPINFDPPAADAIERECEPIRQQVVDLNQKHYTMRGFYRPRMAWLTKQYKQCLVRIKTQEFEYLKHVDLQVRPPDRSGLEDRSKRRNR